MAKAQRRVTVELAKTINLGNYENLRILAGLSEIIPEDETVVEGFERVTDQVGVQLAKMEEEMVTDDDNVSPFDDED